MNEINLFVLGVGTNMEPYYNIDRSQEELNRIGKVLKCSTFIETEPLGFLNQENFVNGAYLFETNLTQEELNNALKSIEKVLGRVKTANKNGPRTIDLDIVVADGKVIDKDFYNRDFLKNSVLEVFADVLY
jgi:2-amino-4-hydroxy-6-hydroxymethyldihydropteridine diphosphokinase